MRTALLLAAALVVVGISAYEPESEEFKPASQFSNQPVKLLSGTNAQPPAPRLPVYVLPETLVTILPDGKRLIFIEQHHLRELAKMFPTVRITNVVIYADGL